MSVCQRGRLEKSGEGLFSRPSDPDAEPIKVVIASDTLKKCHFRENSWATEARIDF